MTPGRRFRRRPWLASLFFCLALPSLGPAPLALAAGQEDELTFLLLEVRLDKQVLSGAIPAYGRGKETLLPMGELARLLTIAVQTQPAQGSASGFILSGERTFSLSVADAQVSRAGKFESFDPALVMLDPDDIYAATSLLERWFPLTFSINRSSQVLEVHASEELPLQARLQRERLAERARGVGGGYQAPQYPFHHSPYRMFDTPFVDQTLATQVGKENGQSSSDSRYTLFMAGDLLGMESSVYLTASEQDPDPAIRATLSRHDPDGRLLGPMNARAVRLGSMSSPGIDNVVQGKIGEGISISNRPLSQPTRFDSQTFEGDLAPGWDVELYYNNSLLDYQQAGSEGRYRFENLPLSYGRNDFQLVFNGPLGQTRVESYRYPLDQSMVRPGEFRYELSDHRDELGAARSVGQFDLGITRNLSASLAFIRAPLDGAETRYSRFAVRTFWQSVSLNASYVRGDDDGQLGEVGLQTRVAGTSIDLSRLHLEDFSSDEFRPSGDPIKTRDELRLSGSLPLGERKSLPLTLNVMRDVRESGAVDTTVSKRLSAYAFGTSFSNTIDWRSMNGTERSSGTFQLSRRVRDVNLRGSMGYEIHPQAEASVIALSADRDLSKGYRISAGVSRNLVNPLTSWSLGLSKSLGNYSFGLSGRYAGDGDYAVGLQFSLGMGQEPRSSNWMVDAQPMAGHGAASLRMFLDDNGNGRLDTGEDPIPDAGFIVNGGRREVRTNANGIAQLGGLPVKQYVDVGVDRSTLFDPQWQPSEEGVSLIPRPGHVVEVDFPVRMTSEIDGTVYLLEGNSERGIGGLELELLDEHMNVTGQTTTAWDGFYIVPAVPSGAYYLRISPKQLRRLKLRDTGVRVITVPANGDFISGMDMVVQRSRARSAPARSSRSPADKPAPAIADSATMRATGDWIHQQPKANYTIQLIAARSEQTIKDFMRDQGITGQSRYFESVYRNAPWYSLIYGSYRTRKAAQLAMDELPPSLMGASPWVRQFGPIQREMK